MCTRDGTERERARRNGTEGKGRERTDNRFGAAAAAVGEELAVAVGAVWLVLLRGELEAGELLLAIVVAAHEALAVVRLAAIRHAALIDHLRTITRMSI